MAATTDITLWIAFSAGLLSFFSPCVLPLFPSYVTYISGVSFGQLKEPDAGQLVRKSVLFHSLAFIFGFSAVFIGLGAIAGLASSTLQTHVRDGLVWLQMAGGVVIFLFGIHLTGLFHFGALLGEKRANLQSKPAGLLGTAVVGVAFAAGWTPCIGPILGGILTMAAGTSGGVEQGTLLLTIYSAGLAIPFLLSSLFFPRFLTFLNHYRKYARVTEIVAGSLLLVMGAMLFFNLFGEFSMMVSRALL